MKSSRISRHPLSRRPVLALAALLLVLSLAAPGWAAGTGATTKRVSVSSAGAEANGQSGTATGEAISADGHFVAFDSFADNLVGSDSNGVEDVFVRGLSTHKTTLVSVSSSGVRGDDASGSPTISADGRFVAFQSLATNLVAGGTTGEQVFLRDLALHKTVLVSANAQGVQGDNNSFNPSVSADGRFVAFTSTAGNLAGSTTGQQVFLRDVINHRTTLVSASSSGVQGDGSSSSPSMSGDGSSIAFASSSTNLVANDTNGDYDIFVRDRKTQRTKRVSVSSAGTESNDGTYNCSISADGRYIVMTSQATNLVGTDSNASSDIFFHDQKTGATKLVSVSSGGVEGNASSFLVDPAITPDGRYVTYTSVATNLVRGGSTGEQVFLRDLSLHKTILVSETSSGAQGAPGSFDSSITSDGRFVAFNSIASNLVTGDTAGFRDVFVRGPLH